MQRRMFVAVAIGGMLGLLAAAPVLAHHGWSGYDASQTLDLTGVIREAGYEHPHGHRSEEHTSELQSHHDLVCRLLLEKKKKKTKKKKHKTPQKQKNNHHNLHNITHQHNQY